MIVVLGGGMGSFLGALLGGFVVGLAGSIGAAVLPGSLKQLPIFALFVLVLLFRAERAPRPRPWLASRRRSRSALLRRCRRSSRPTPSTRSVLVLFFAYLGNGLERRCRRVRRSRFSFGHAGVLRHRRLYTSTRRSSVRLGSEPMARALAGGVLAAAFGVLRRDTRRSATGSVAPTSPW